MTSGALTAPPRGAAWRLPAVNSAVWPLTGIVALLGLQLSLIFVKSFNWDEFLHYSMVHQWHEGTLARPFQTLLARLLSWAPSVSDDLVAQMMAARVFIWSIFLVGLGSLYGLARQFVSREEALWTTLVYLAAGNVFAHGFAIRADPPAMAVLMLALYVLASRRLGWPTVLAVGALVGLAGMLTMKAVFYAPCFAGVAWLSLSRADDKRRALMALVAIVPVAAATFAGLYLWHRAGLATVPPSQQGGSFLVNGLQWLTDGLFRQPRHTVIAFATAPVLAFALIKAPAAWRGPGLSRDKAVALLGLCLPLLVIVFYRNVFPYFFVFIFAPVAVAVAPAISGLRKRHGTVLLAAALCVVPLVKFAAEPRDVIERQRATIDYLHEQFPPGTTSLDYSGMVADYPRVLDHLVSGIGLANYRERGVPLVARAVTSGELAFVIENRRSISLGLAGMNDPEGLLPADVAALHGNFVRAWGLVWLAGEYIPAGAAPIAIDVPHGSSYTPNADLTVDGTRYLRGEVVELSAGRHLVTGPRPRRAVLWRGERLPAPPPQIAPGRLFTKF